MKKLRRHRILEQQRLSRSMLATLQRIVEAVSSQPASALPSPPRIAHVEVAELTSLAAEATAHSQAPTEAQACAFQTASEPVPC